MFLKEDLNYNLKPLLQSSLRYKIALCFMYRYIQLLLLSYKARHHKIYSRKRDNVFYFVLSMSINTKISTFAIILI